MKKAKVFWFTGLSGAGKTTVAFLTLTELERHGVSVFVVDGDEFRSARSRHLGFSEEDIKKNNEMIAAYCAELQPRYDVILVPIISPYRESRQKAREVLHGDYFEIYLEASLDCLVARDTKGLYQKAKNNEITTLIGYSKTNPYEAPAAPDLTLRTEGQTPGESAGILSRFIIEHLGASAAGSESGA